MKIELGKRFTFSSIYIARKTIRRVVPPHSRAFAALCALLLSGGMSAASAVERVSIKVGGEGGWDTLESATALQETEGRLSLPALGIAPRAGSGAQAATDLYLSFDEADFADLAGNYNVESSPSFFADRKLARQGEGAAIFNTSGSGLIARGGNGTLFAQGGHLPSFTISFWLYPSSTKTGSVLFSWRSSIVPESGQNPIYQSILARFDHNRLVWDFSKLWFDPSGKPLSAKLEPDRVTIPKKWSLHQVSYEETTGYLEYRINGRTEAFLYVGRDAQSGRSAVARGFIGAQADIEIAPKYSGLMDEFKIDRAAMPQVNVEGLREIAGFYPAAGGKFVTKPIDTGAGISRLVSADISVIEPEGTESEFYVRAGDNCYEWTEDAPQWVPLVNGKPAEEVSGQYIQVAGGLYPDGTRSKTPLLTWISLNIEKENAPWPPLKVRGEAGSGSVKISWNPPADSGVRGYLVYYGEGQGEYLSQGSPIDAGSSLSCVVSGLENGKMYYFAVASYGEAGVSYPGGFSPEIAVRPLVTKALIE